jgi:L-fuconolactonase
MPLIIDHLNLRHLKPPEVWADLEELLDLSALPNISVKATCLPAYSAEPYPFVHTHDTLRRVVDAFGPKRIFWGSDLTRLPVAYEECVRQITEGLDWLGGEDKEWVMGRAISTPLGLQTNDERE